MTALSPTGSESAILNEFSRKGYHFFTIERTEGTENFLFLPLPSADWHL